ncbi:MAG: hypothetical protein LQ337_004266 [Flavoplaca oasis]|nr:MAG: hypothetical protein LQ337_004266 [Flavoplaca oasis]
MGLEEGFRLLAEHEEKVNRRKTEEALAAGFTSFEEHERHKELQEEIEQEEAIRQHCLATGKSREQYDREREEFLDEQLRRHPKPPEDSFLPPMDNCTCQEHAFPLFCPTSLIDYKSQDFPDMMEYISNKHHLDPEDIKIQDTDKSKRLDQKHWDLYMGWKPDDATVALPFWARAEGVTLQIMRQSGLQEASTSPGPSPPQAPSLLPNNPTSNSPSADDVITDSMDTSVEVEATDGLIRLPDSHEIPLTKVRQNELPPTGAEEHIRKGRQGEVRKRRPKAMTKLTDWRSKKNLRITKSSWRPAMGLRSRNVTTFYKLSCDGKAADYLQ